MAFSKRRGALAAVAAAVLLVGAGFLILRWTSRPEAPSETPAPAVDAPAGWVRRAEDRHRFGIAFPATFSVHPQATSFFAPLESALALLIIDPSREPSIIFPAKADVPATREFDGIGVNVYDASHRAAVSASIDAAVERGRKDPAVFRITMATVGGEPVALYRVPGPFGPYWTGYVNKGIYLFVFTTQGYDKEIKDVLATITFAP